MGATQQCGCTSEASSYQNEAELELGLGLSLGGCGGGSVKTKAGSPWGEYGRILTANDFPNGFSTRASSVSGTKRAATHYVAPPEVGSASTTAVSQVVGWPPIRAYRMNSLFNQTKAPNAEEDKVVLCATVESLPTRSACIHEPPLPENFPMKTNSTSSLFA